MLSADPVRLSSGFVPGAPGVFAVVPSAPDDLRAVRRDVAAFAGISPRGPARLPPGRPDDDVDVATWLAVTAAARSVPLAVGSWDEYRVAFGGFEGPGRLPYAVRTFFAQGGARAYVVRIVHDEPEPADVRQGRASGPLGLATGGGPAYLFARSEGSWGNRLRVVLNAVARPLATDGTTTAEVILRGPGSAALTAGALLRLTLPGGAQVLRFAERAELRPDPAGPGQRLHLLFQTAVAQAPSQVELVDVGLDVVDADPALPRLETFAGLGLRPDHPRWLARVLIAESALLWPDPAWAAQTLSLPDAALPPIRSASFTGGADRWADVVPEDFWDPSWIPGDERIGAGVHCLAEVDDVGLLMAPDLYDPAPLTADPDVLDQVSTAGPEFQPCLRPDPPDPATPRIPGLDGLRLDPLMPDELDRIVAAQRELVAFADRRREFTVLLDAPLGLPPARILRWRTAFASPYAAAYHPWLDVAAPDDDREALIRLNPAAFAAGIIAAREQRLGIPRGPANEIAVGAVRAATDVPGAVHDELHLAGINVFRGERDGIRLTAARTLSLDPRLRQLSVARLMTVLRLTLERQLAWVVFEPNGPDLWARIRRVLTGLLTRFFEAGAFAGAGTREAFFVRCDRGTMTGADLDSGRLLCLVGVAPAEPLEYIVVRIAREPDASLRIETR
ncbi:phage tail sheath subtilisin-like domain-containing protein [Actinoplanes sp. M2I2]|uniref:phage tail sheath subtilisin-like domain-containing protein n=1 Tax=Actinoplanes sp. M2I2 TaxID=1734444 RepID=UPI00201FC399|nr:phage tail sheath subtilisin-like domain-containing protein [Actinoplanes sp. M2I2]